VIVLPDWANNGMLWLSKEKLKNNSRQRRIYNILDLLNS